MALVFKEFILEIKLCEFCGNPIGQFFKELKKNGFIVFYHSYCYSVLFPPFTRKVVVVPNDVYFTK